jgi:NAD(P)-dependent dehydrogenase (short-subunit alcohol dehydrogenase family)
MPHFLTTSSGTAGLGSQTVLSLAAHSPCRIFFTGRSTSRAATLISDIAAKYPKVSTTFLELDLASFTSVQEKTRKFIASFPSDQKPRLDILICNAGVMALSPGLTSDGYEIQFGTNHLGHALLVKLLMPTLLLTAAQPGSDVRIVFLSSLAFSGHPSGGILFDSLKSEQDSFLPGTGPWQRYGQSKLANILYAAELARKFGTPEIGNLTAVSIHPGTFNTHLVSSLGLANRAMIYATNMGNVKDAAKEREGSWNSCWAATGPKEKIVNGAFYLPIGVKGKKFRANKSKKLAEELWEWTEKELEGWEVS